MKKLNPLEFQTGFLMGAFFGFSIEAIILFIYNFGLSNLFDWPKLNLSWWWYLPFPLISGIFWGRAIASLHLEDY